jgi:integrase
LRGLRDRALLLFGWAAALRRSELAALRVDDVHFEPEGAVLTIRRSKTDQDAAGETVAVPFGEEEATCPVRALRAWLDVRGAEAAAGAVVFGRIDRHGNIGASLTPMAMGFGAQWNGKGT